MVKERNATDPAGMVGARMEATTAVETETMSLAGADEPRPTTTRRAFRRGNARRFPKT